MVSSTSKLIQSNLTDFWADFNPDLPDEDDPPVNLNDLWQELRMRTAPWGEDDREKGTVSIDSSLQDDPAHSTSDDAGSLDTPSVVSSGGVSMSGAPLGIRLKPCEVHLLHPTAHRISRDAVVTNPGVDTPFALRLRGVDADWYERTVT